MSVILVSGSGTGIGKTWVARALVRHFEARGTRHLQVIKPVETGVRPGCPEDAPFVAAGLAAHATLHTCAEPMAPLEAALREGQPLDFAALVRETRARSGTGVTLVEGAGGLGVPLAEDGRDWADFALAIEAEAVVLVVPNRLGMINHWRLLCHYAQRRGLRAGAVLNVLEDVAEPIDQANRKWLARSCLPWWGTLSDNCLHWQPEAPKCFFPRHDA